MYQNDNIPMIHRIVPVVFGPHGLIGRGRGSKLSTSGHTDTGLHRMIAVHLFQSSLWTLIISF